VSEIDYPLLAAQTGKFRRGAPRNFKLSAQAHSLAFLRSKDGYSSKLDLWIVSHLDSVPEETLLIDTEALVFNDAAMSDKEKARRERLREAGSGITQFSANQDLSIFVFALSGALFIWQSGKVRPLGQWSAVVDPQLDPKGEFVAFTSGQDFVVCDVAGNEIVKLPSQRETEFFGLADFIASEELSRFRGHWWSPDGNSLLVQKTDESPVANRWISDPTNPELPARLHRYPQAGTNNADLELLLIDLHTKEVKSVWKSTQEIPYLPSVGFSAKSGWFTTLNRAQQRLELFKIVDGNPVRVHTEEDAAWIDCGKGMPQLCLADVVVTSKLSAKREVFFDGKKIEFDDGHIQDILAVTNEGVTFSAYTKPWKLVIFQKTHELVALSDRDGFASGVIDGEYSLIAQSTADSSPRYLVKRSGDTVHEVSSNALNPELNVKVEFHEVTSRALPVAILWPEHSVTSGPLPILVNIYGGPHHSEVVAARQTFYDDQWLANQGFCVVVIDNAGNPGKGPAWEREVFHDFSNVILNDQVNALREICERFSDRVDETRVGIAGWSFGGYLSALAVLDRPDVYKAAWAGAPVTDWRLYDTAYTERYLSHPDTYPDVYVENSLIERAHKLSRPLTLVHGLADDNVLAAHSLQLSRALLAHGKSHNFLPLAGVSHMTPQEDITKNLMVLMLQFFQQHLAANKI
jgi:dipeptidyl-peptidase-4